MYTKIILQQIGNGIQLSENMLKCEKVSLFTN